MTLGPEDLNPTDRAILDMLWDEGRTTIANVADEHGYSRGNVGNQMRRLEEHDHVRKVHKGLYELIDDPRREGLPIRIDPDEIAELVEILDRSDVDDAGEWADRLRRDVQEEGDA